VQRFRSDLGLYVHLHCLVTDGAYEEQGDGERATVAAGAERLRELGHQGGLSIGLCAGSSASF
jgi:hypothetical protein